MDLDTVREPESGFRIWRRLDSDNLIFSPLFPTLAERSLEGGREPNWDTSNDNRSNPEKEELVFNFKAKNWLNECDPIPEFGPKKFQKPAFGPDMNKKLSSAEVPNLRCGSGFRLLKSDQSATTTNPVIISVQKQDEENVPVELTENIAEDIVMLSLSEDVDSNQEEQSSMTTTPKKGQKRKKSAKYEAEKRVRPNSDNECQKEQVLEPRPGCSTRKANHRVSSPLILRKPDRSQRNLNKVSTRMTQMTQRKRKRNNLA